MKRLTAFLAITFIIISSSFASAQDGRNTTFRGIHIGMSRDELKIKGPSDFYYDMFPTSGIGDHATVMNISRQDCGIIFFKDNVVERFTLDACFFEVTNMSLRDFAQAITDSYMIDGMTSGVEIVDTINGKARIDFYSGKTLLKENVKVFVNNIPGFPATLRVTVNAASGGKFN